MSNGSTSWTKSLFSGIWSVLNFSRKLFFNLIFLGLAFFILSAIFSGDGDIKVPKQSALVLNLNGDVVIEARAVDPFEEFMQEAFDQRDERPEVLLQDVLFTIENAKQDNRIKALVLNLQGLSSGGLDKLRAIADAIEDFKTSEKPVYAIGDYFTQNQYYLASHADNLYLHPMGFMMLEGFSRYRLYYKTALEKLKATTHVFRVGTFKSAVEPFIRDDMSEAAKEANQEWLGALWEHYKADVGAARGMDPGNFDETLESFTSKFDQADGSFAQYALDYGWVDALKTREQVRGEMQELLAKADNRDGYARIGYKDYLKVIKPPFPLQGRKGDKVGVVVAKGTILNGSQKPGMIGGDSTARLLRKARLDDDVKAVVMYVDSPGGSAFASEVIRQEVEQLKAAGKPVVAAMSTYAASGGYWISASADEIWASPSTITGSIGIFGMFMTYEKTLDYLGVHSDGVSTTELGAMGITQALDPRVGNIIQRSIENGYDNFLSLVASERDMTKEDVDKIAQGRVWIGEKAKELGLVDQLGTLDDAIQSAAKMANLERYDTRYIEREMSSKEKFWQEFFGVASVAFAKAHIADSDSHLVAMVKQLVSEFDSLAKFNDPRGMYAFCLTCEI